MKVSLKVILGIWLLLFIIIGGVIYSSYSKFNPDNLVALIKKQVEKNYPGSELFITGMKYRFSLDLKVVLNDIKLIRSGEVIGRVGEIEIKLPWWTLLSDAGNAQINVSRMEIFLDFNSSRSKKKSPKKASAPSPVTAEIPEFLAGSSYTLRAKEIVIRDSKDSHRYFNLSKFLIREFQYGKNSAFELTIPVEVNHNAAKYNSELWLFGDVTPGADQWEINFRGDFRTNEVAEKFQLEDVVIGGKASLNPSGFHFNSHLSFQIEREQIGEGKVLADQKSFSVFLHFSKFPLSYLTIINEEIKNPFLPKLEGHGAGDLKFQKDFNDATITLNSKLTFEGILPLGDQTVYAGKWLLAFDNAKWETSFITPNGEVSFFRRSIIDFKSGTLVQYNEEIGFTGIDFNKALAPIQTLSQFQTLTAESQAYFSSTASFKQCLQGESIINGHVKYGTSPSLKFYQVELEENKRFLKLAFQQKASVRNFSLEADKFRWFPSYQLLTPYFHAADGIFSGRMQGNWSEEWLDGEWLLNVKTQELASPSGVLPSMLQQILQVFSLDQNVPVQSWHVAVRKKAVEIKSIMLATSDPAKISGSLGPGAAQPSLVLTYPSNKKWKPVMKEVKDLEWKKD